MASNPTGAQVIATGSSRSAAPRSRNQKVKQALLQWGLLIFLVLLVIIFWILEPRFATLTNFQNVMRQAAPLALLAAGQAVVLIAGGVDVSVGSIIALSSVSMVGALYQTAGVPFTVDGVLPGIAASILVGGIIGAINGAIIAVWSVSAFIVTLAMMTTIRGLALYVTGGMPMYDAIPESMLYIGNGYVGPVPFAVFISVLGFALLYYFLRLTPGGRETYALGGNQEAARLSGIKIKPTIIRAYLISGLFAGAAGAVLTSRGGIGAPNMGTGLELDAIAAAVIGGVAFGGGEGRVMGVILGVLVLSVIKNGLNLYNVSSFVQLIVIGFIIVAAVVVDRYRHKADA